MDDSTDLAARSERLLQSVYGGPRRVLARNDEQWVLYVERAPGRVQPGLPELWDRLKQHSERLLLPHRCVFVETLPMLPDGTVDRERLGKGWGEEPASYEAPKGVTEQLLSALWLELLPGSKPGRTDQLFSVGADPSAAAKLASRIREVFEAHLTPQELIEARTLQAQARLVERRMGGA